MKCFSSRTDVLHRPLILIISRCCFGERNVPICKTQVQSVRSYCFCSLNRLFCSVPVAVAPIRSFSNDDGDGDGNENATNKRFN